MHFIQGCNAYGYDKAYLFYFQSVCVLVAVLLHYLYLASFGWMLLEGVFLYIMIVEVFSTVSVRYLYLFAWGKQFINNYRRS